MVLMITNKEFQNIHFKIVQLINKGSNLQEVIQFLVDNLEEIFQSPFTHISLLEVDEMKQCLIKVVGTSTRGNKRNYTYNYSNQSKDFLTNNIFVKDIQSDKRWSDYIHIANELNLHASWTFPLINMDKKVFAILNLGFKDGYIPKEEKIPIVEEYVHLLTISFELLRNRVRGCNKNNKSDVEQDFMLFSLKNALHNNEFVVYYQPYYSLKSEGIGVEALIRWKHPKLGLLAPASFLPEAEKTGFIHKIEKWVLNQAISDIIKLEKKVHKDILLSVNISAKHLEKEDFVEYVQQVIEQYDFQPKQLTLEITERFNIYEEHITVLNALQNYGVRISIDDFGKSFSSLHYLKQLPLNELKIDRDFISDIQSNDRNRRIVEMIIRLAQDLNLEIVGEGVEKTSQLTLLKEMGCDYVQGFLFSKPVPFEKLTNYLNMNA